MPTKSNERLAVSTAGMRELHADRPAWMLVKELVQNAWDEDSVSMCEVFVDKVMTESGRMHPKQTKIRVTDDGNGFADIKDAYTLMGWTPKRMDLHKRGRFNIGEKELLSVALAAEIETVGWTIQFPRGNGRVEKRNKREHGTMVTLLMPWSRNDREECIEMLRKFRPTDTTLVVNGEYVNERRSVRSHDCTLATVLQSERGEPMRNTRRRTTLDILERVDPERSWLYEMGIPIQEIDIAYDVDVMQKVPMPPNRDTVGSAYLQDVSAEVLNATYDILEGDDFAETWVRTALEDDRIEKPAVMRTKHERYGDKVALWSSNTDANMRAAEQGYEVLHPRAMSPEERTNLRDLGGLRSANDMFGRISFVPSTSVKPTDVMNDFSRWVVRIGRICGMSANVQFINHDTNVMADCSGAGYAPTIRFNTKYFDDRWFSERGGKQVEVVVHELAHALSDTPMSHGPTWGEAVAKIAGLVWANRMRLED